MKYRIRIRSDAEADLRQAREWYARVSQELGVRFGDELAAVFQAITSDAIRFPRVHSNVRRALTRRFPYAVYFVVDGERVSVLRVLHQARDPREWKR